MPTPAAPNAPSEAQALRTALEQVLMPLARLAVAKGMPCAQVEDVLQLAFVQAAREVHTDALPHRMVSRISTATGLNRRTVTRLVNQPDGPAKPRRSPAAEVFAHWLTDSLYLQKRGKPRVLPRQGLAPSFETLAQGVTRDVHPRSLLDELLRLGLARLDASKDTVALVPDAFAPKGDALRLLAFLGDNVGDHLAAAVANVRTGGGLHVERAIFADGLSAASAEDIRATVRAHWQKLVEALVPVLEARIEADAQAAAPATQRLRIGMFSYDEPATPGSVVPHEAQT